MLLEEVTKAIIIQLNVNTNITVYREKVEQGFKEPSFFVKILLDGFTKGVDNRFFDTYSYDIHYFPEQNGRENKSCIEMIRELKELLYFLPTQNGMLRAENISSEIIDGVLHFQIDYVINAIKTKEVNEKMRQTEMEVHIDYE